MDQSVSPRWTDTTRSEEIAELVSALAMAQSEIKAPERNRTVKVSPRDQSKTSYSFKYATLDHIIDIIRGPLTSNGLWFTQIMKDDQGTYILDTRLMHSSGQWLACQVPLIVEGGSNQQFGSALTFMRRYSLTSLLGIAAEEDDDANVADGNAVEQAVDRKPVSPKPDVITTNVQPSAQVKDIAPYQVPVNLTADGTGSDWVDFGKILIAYVKASKNDAIGREWVRKNALALDELQKAAPKISSNLNASMTKAINELPKLENVNAG